MLTWTGDPSRAFTHMFSLPHEKAAATAADGWWMSEWMDAICVSVPNLNVSVDEPPVMTEQSIVHLLTLNSPWLSLELSSFCRLTMHSRQVLLQGNMQIGRKFVLLAWFKHLTSVYNSCKTIVGDDFFFYNHNDRRYVYEHVYNELLSQQTATQRRRWDPKDSRLASYDKLQGRTCKFPGAAIAMGHLRRTENNARKI